MLCGHQLREVGEMLYHARHLGRICGVMAHEVKACNLSVADLTQWKRVYVRFLFRENIIEARCPTCGHEAVQ